MINQTPKKFRVSPHNEHYYTFDQHIDMDGELQPWLCIRDLLITGSVMREQLYTVEQIQHLIDRMIKIKKDCEILENERALGELLTK